MANRNYENISEIKKMWLEQIAPNYLDLSTYNNYNIGMLGYINEVMANSIEDGLNAANIARREFYPATSQFVSSLYKMATVQSIDIPTVTPSACSVGLLIDQVAIIDNSTYKNGVYTCVIDNVLKIMADNLQFMLDYPIIILSKKSANGWTHTVHYDITYKNSLNTDTASRYISTKIIKNQGVNYLFLMIDTVRQVELQSISSLVLKDNTLDTVYIDVDYTGNLANFEVFYRQNQTSPLVQLDKILENGALPPGRLSCYYKHIQDGKLRLIFLPNGAFTPALNSEIITRVYTSQGKAGNFEMFKGSLNCSSDSTDYPYNSNIMITGLVNGSAIGGKDAPTIEEFRSQIIKAYSTNLTYVTSNDLQVYFDDLSDHIENMKVMFRKKRDDALIRLFGAYVLLKDSSNDVVPSNTLNVSLHRSDIMMLNETKTRVMIKPGSLFVYTHPDQEMNFDATILNDGTLITDNLPEDNIYFTNPFLIGINITPNTIGYYKNSVRSSFTMDYTYVNDNTENQFITKKVTLTRNAINGQNFYKVSANISMATSDADINVIAHINDKTDENNIFRAKLDGRVISTLYKHTDTTNYIETIVKYSDDTTDTIISSNYMEVDPNDSSNFIYHTGYTMQFDPGKSFVQGDIIAIKNDDDLGKLRLCIDFSQYLFINGYYIPMLLESVDTSVNGFTFSGYISTDDAVDINSMIVINHGILTKTGLEEDNIAIPMNGLSMEINAFYKNDDTNYNHRYDEYTYFTGYTLTNSYMTKSDQTVDLITEIQYIRSVVDFREDTDPQNYIIDIDEMPLLDAHWAKINANYDYFIEKIQQCTAKLDNAYRVLENNFAIDLKFYNTYGKARFYSVGITGDIRQLNNVNCSFSFGVWLNTVTNNESFITKLRTYIKDYVESTNDITTEGKDIYILNMIADIKSNFTEIGYMEYYGFNIYDHTAQKIIGPDLNDYHENYIPEFLNIQKLQNKNDESYPNISIALLES